MKKCFAVLLFLFMSLCLPEIVQAMPEVTATAAVLMDAESGQVYFAKNAGQSRYPASLTKIMTAVIALESGNLKETVTVNGSETDGTIIDLQKGDRLTLENLIKAALICSANDATVVIAKHIGGSHENFVRMMNAKAKAIGAFHSRFTNTNGLHNPNHYSTAYDIALITRYALRNSQFAGLVKTREAVIKWQYPQRELPVSNSNRLLLFSSYPGIDGVKTGTTFMAGNCLVASATRSGRKLVAVVLSSEDRYRDARVLLDYGFDEVGPRVILQAGGKVASAGVREGEAGAVDAVSESALELYLAEKDIPRLERKIYLPESLVAPIQKGEKLGYAAFFLGGQELGRSNLVAGRQVRRQAWYRRLWKINN